MTKRKERLLYSQVECAQNLASVDDAIYVIGGKWRLKIMITLVSGYSRFNEIQRTIKGISARVLSNELKELETNGLVERTVDVSKIPVLVEYIPTQYAETLKNIVNVLGSWGKQHKKMITTQIKDLSSSL